jgi:hypothetical protein
MPQRRVIVGLVGGLLALSSVIRAAPAADVPKERRLHVASAEASSYLVNDWNKFQENYLPLYVGDDDPKTAWTLKTEGIGEWLRVHVTPMAGATKVRLRIRNGYQKSDKLWAANSRAKGLSVVLLPSKKTVDVELTDTKGWQEIAVEQPAGAFEAVELHVRSVYAGKKYDDLCLSDVQVFVTATTADNPALEKQRLQKILDWKKERLAAAELFKSELAATMPIAAQYVRSGGDDDAEYRGSECKDVECEITEMIARAQAAHDGKRAESFKRVRALTAAHFAGMTPVRISTRDPRPVPHVDGVCLREIDSCSEDACYEALPLPPKLGFLDAQSLVTTEQNGLPLPDDVLAMKVPQCRRTERTTFAYVAREGAAPGAIRVLLLVTCGLVEGREGMYPSAVPQLLVYGADGMLDGIATPYEAATMVWSRDGKDAKLASATVNNRQNVKPLEFEAATTVVAGK